MKYEVFDMEIGGGEIQRIVNIMITEDSAVNFPADNANESYLEFLASQNLTDKEVHALEVGVWYDLIAPAIQEEVAPVVAE